MYKESIISVTQGSWGFFCGAMFANTESVWIFVIYGVGIIILRFAVDGFLK